jgi:hypothetical protein
VTRAKAADSAAKHARLQISDDDAQPDGWALCCSAAVSAAVVGASRSHAARQDALAAAGRMPALQNALGEFRFYFHRRLRYCYPVSAFPFCLVKRRIGGFQQFFGGGSVLRKFCHTD